MIDKLKQYSEAWAEFVEWMKKDYDFDEIIETFLLEGTGISDYELYGLAIEWLDSKGIWVEIIRGGNEFLCTVAVSEPYDDVGYYSSSRSEATEVGIIHSFGIYNQKEK